MFKALFGRGGNDNDTTRIRKLIVGLGNPGDEYAFTRHNVGFMVVDRMAALEGAAIDEESCNALCGPVRLRGAEKGDALMLAKPLTFMNSSGEAVKALLNRWELKLEDVLVIVDDFELPLGSLRLKAGGSHGGHNGLKSIGACLESDSFVRLRVGIGGPLKDSSKSIIDFVLGRFTEEEEDALGEAVDRAAELVPDWAVYGVEYCQNKYNRRTEMPSNVKREDII